MFFPLISFVIKIVFVPVKNKHQNKIKVCLTVFPLEVFLIKVFFVKVFYKITIKMDSKYIKHYQHVNFVKTYK